MQQDEQRTKHFIKSSNSGKVIIDVYSESLITETCRYQYEEFFKVAVQKDKSVGQL